MHERRLIEVPTPRGEAAKAGARPLGEMDGPEFRRISRVGQLAIVRNPNDFNEISRSCGATEPGI